MISAATVAGAEANERAIAQRIRALRRARRWAQVDLAARCGVQRFAVTRWECGAYFPDLIHLCRIADAFEVSLDQLVRGKP